ncbi:MAG: ATP-binding protein [Polyangiaceae bacterium]
MLELSRALHEATTLSEAMDTVLAAVERHTRYRRAWLLLPMSPTRGLEVIGYALPDRARIEQRMAEIEFAKDPFLRMHLEAKEPRVMDDLRLEPLADQQQVAHWGNRTLISVPMLRVAERVGALCVGTFAADGVLPPTAEEVDFIVQIGAMLSVVAGRIRAEQAHRELEEKVRNAQRLESLGRMAGEIAHDFNNMLVAILGNADGAKQMLARHPALELVEEIEQAALRAAQLTRQLLSFSRGQPLQRREIQLESVINGFLSMLEHLLPASTRLDVRNERDLHAVFADAGQVEQVIMNLVVNARDAMPSGGAITLSSRAFHCDAEFARTHSGAREGEYVVLSVSDTGVGMPAEVRERVFEPFFTTKASGGGTGLGLAVVETILKRHEGFIGVDSEVGRGTSVHAYFPASQRTSEVTLTPSTESLPSPAGNELLLLADDDRQVRVLLERVLTSAGYRVLPVEDGQAALDALAREPRVALVLSDLVMPRLGGNELRDILLTRPGAPPVLIMSGYARGDAALTNFEHLLAKPFSPQELLQKVRSVLDSSKAALSVPAA